jgi:prepilin-type N-terminal cleavage/methylation domain-containing protein
MTEKVFLHRFFDIRCSLIQPKLKCALLLSEKFKEEHCQFGWRTSDVKKSAGFTLIEIILSLALISILVSIGMPIYQSFQTRNDLDVAAVEIVQTARRAQVLAQASDGDSSWGIFFQPDTLTLFKGTSSTTRDASFDENFEISPAITPTGLSQIVFTKFSGETSDIGVITLTSSTNETRTITINKKGMASY